VVHITQSWIVWFTKLSLLGYTFFLGNNLKHMKFILMLCVAMSRIHIVANGYVIAWLPTRMV